MLAVADAQLKIADAGCGFTTQVWWPLEIDIGRLESPEILRRIADEKGILQIFDEIITGFARTGNMFAAQTFGVTPDII
ncbi:MAG: aminotransferase class III-fold pyridoxal phosphate-dependent enzyme, partial [Caldilineaceae bacterium]|nr:aminotransferase class III-fold pyridoxal phosphate-dependent enzyme [Caldilineaceae bacterium]